MFRRRTESTSSQAPPRKSRVIRPGIEALDRRELLAAGLASVAYYPATGELVINGSSNDDRVLVTRNDLRGGIIEVRQLFAVDNRAFRGGPWEQDITGPVTKITFNGNDGNDSFANETSIGCQAVGGAGNDTLVGGSGDDVLVGGSGDDRLEAGGGNNALYGGSGSDTLIAGNGKDYLAGLGKDAAVVELSPGKFNLQYSGAVATGPSYDYMSGFDQTDFNRDGCDQVTISITQLPNKQGTSPRFNNPVVTPYSPPKQQPGPETPPPGFLVLDPRL